MGGERASRAHSVVTSSPPPGIARIRDEQLIPLRRFIPLYRSRGTLSTYALLLQQHLHCARFGERSRKKLYARAEGEGFDGFASFALDARAR